MNSTLDLDAIKKRWADLDTTEDYLRKGRAQSGDLRWPFGDLIRATLGDVYALIRRVEELEAELARRSHEPDPLRAALVGILRADGYDVFQPGSLKDMLDKSAVITRELLEPPPFEPDAATSDMLGEDEVDARQGDPAGSGADEAYREAFQSAFTAPTVCPNCEQPLPPDGKCRSPYVDCQRGASDTEPPAAALLPPGESVRITGNGQWLGRYAIVETHEPGKFPSVCVVAKGAELANAVDVAHVLVVNPDVNDPPKADAPAAKARQRAPELPKLVTEWAPDGKDFEGYSKELPCSAAQLEGMLGDFRAFVLSNTPDKRQARWGGTFKDWAKARLTNQA